VEKENNKFKKFILQNVYFFKTLDDLALINDFVKLFDTPCELLNIIKRTVLTTTFIKTLLTALKNKENFWMPVMKYYASRKIEQMKAKNLFLRLIKNKWIIENAIFFKGPVLSYQLYNDLDERLYADIDIIIKKESLYKLIHLTNSKFSRYQKFICEVPTNYGSGTVIESIFLESIPFPIHPYPVYIEGKWLQTIDITETAKVFTYFSFLPLKYLDERILKNFSILNKCKSIQNNFKNKTIENYSFFSLTNYLFYQLKQGNTDDTVLQDFFRIPYNSDNILKKMFFLLKFIKKYNIELGNSHILHNKSYLIRSVLYKIYISLK
jgi:hypothetical protein